MYLISAPRQECPNHCQKNYLYRLHCHLYLKKHHFAPATQGNWWSQSSSIYFSTIAFCKGYNGFRTCLKLRICGCNRSSLFFLSSTSWEMMTSQTSFEVPSTPNSRQFLSIIAASNTHKTSGQEWKYIYWCLSFAVVEANAPFIWNPLTSCETSIIARCVHS